MTLYHLLTQHWGAGAATGVPRFSRYFQQAFPDVNNITPGLMYRTRFSGNDVVVTDNHLSLLVPDYVRTIVVHHGCAWTHYARDPGWRSAWSEKLAHDQREMFKRQNRTYVAPSRWVAEQFEESGFNYNPHIIPHWVPLIPQAKPAYAGEMSRRPRTIGDWRGFNKGAPCIEPLRKLCPEWDFIPLDFSPAYDDARAEFYQSADAYLCLSLSEGGPYSVADAEAASLPIVSTETGYCREFSPTLIDRADDPEDVAHIRDAIRKALHAGRGGHESFYATWTFERWQAAWREVIDGG